MVFISISYIPFIDIKGTALGHGQVVEMCSMPSSISVALKASKYHPRLFVAIYICIYVAVCYAAWNNKYSGQ